MLRVDAIRAVVLRVDAIGADAIKSEAISAALLRAGVHRRTRRVEVEGRGVLGVQGEVGDDRGHVVVALREPPRPARLGVRARVGVGVGVG